MRHDKEELFIELLGKDDLGLIGPLWERLNGIHLKDSRFWKERFRRMTFEKRAAGLLKKDASDLHCQVIKVGGNYLGYCLSSVDREKKLGQIESLYLEGAIRGLSWGTELVDRALLWLKEQGAERITVSVSEGHEGVFSFYQKRGFAPKMTTLELKD
ncbi:MAG: GNAT family N-acetyltransferase [Spirochaetales bacterium]|nr:GNAT family N-acetyltransferase [Spirochaetales bacterium]